MTAGNASDVGVAGLPLVPGNVPVPEPFGARQRRSHRVDDFDDVAALGVVVEPDRGAGADVEAAVTGVGVALGAHRPRRGMYEDAAVGNLGGPVDVGAISVGGVYRNAEGRRVHDDV